MAAQDPRTGKSDWTELDLLTRGEAGDRLDEFQAEADAEVARLQGDPASDPAAVAMAVQRADALRASTLRIREGG
jgi:hypothetical protein